ETFKATEGELLLDTYIRYLKVINDLKKGGYSKDKCKLKFKFLNNLQPEWKQYATMMRQNKNLMDINIDALYNILKQNRRDVNDAMGLKKKIIVVTSDPLALIAEKTKVSKRKEKVVVSSDSEGSDADDFSELKKITALLAKAFNRRKVYSKPTNNNLRTSSTSQSANKKQEFVKLNDKKVEKKDDERKQDMSKVKCYNCKKEGHFSKDCKKVIVKDYEYYKTKISDSDKEINANMVFMAQIKKVHSDSEAISSFDDDKIFEVSYYLSETESESEYETSEYYDNIATYGLFVNDNDNQEIFHDCENFPEYLIESQINHNESAIDHNDSEGVDKLIKNFNKKIVKCQKRIEKANQQSKYFENQNKDLQEKYDILKNQTTSFEMNNKELKEQVKELIEKKNDLLAETKVLKDQIQVKHVVIDTHAECQEKYAKLKAERYEYVIRYSAYFDNDKQHRKQIADQEVLYDKMSVQLVELDKHIRDLKNTVLEKDFKIFELKECVRNKDLEIENVWNQTSSLKLYVPTVILEKIIIDLEDEVVSLLEKKANLETIKSLKSKGFESSENAICESENQSENDCQVVEKECDQVENLKQTSSLKPYVPNVILEKIIIDLKDEVVNLLEKEKVNLETIESLKSKSFESSENVISESENQNENYCHVNKKECEKEENPKVIAPGMFKLSVSQCVSPISMSKSAYLDTFSSVRRPKHRDVIWKKKWSSNTSNVDLSSVSHLKVNKDVKRYSRKDLLACNNSHLGETNGAYVCNDAMNVSCHSRMCDLLDDNNFFIFDDESVKSSPVSKMHFRKKPRDSMIIVHICLWIIDSGCSKHMEGNRALLMNFAEKFLETVRFGNNDFAVVAGYGDVVISSMTIKKVYYVEGLGHNLFSIGQFYDKGLEVAFRKSTCFVRYEDGVDLLTGDRSSNLYTIALNEVASNSSNCLLAKASSSQSWLWHQRKIHRKHHKSKMAFASNKPLYLLHIDLYGPMRVQSINGKRYVLVVVDDYSWCTWVFFLYSKDEASEIMKSPIMNVESSNVEVPSHEEEVFHEISESFQGESSSSSLNDDVQQISEEVILPQTNTQSISNNMIPNGDEASTSHNPYPHEKKWTKDHSLYKIIGDSKSSVRTRGQVANSCLFSCLLSSIEPANMAEALRDADWVSAMQEELDKFSRLKVWRLVPRPEGKSVIKTK
nr:integrase, catalytic region, zinc finger, CCHC-type, peptidase aspartic, catalytic [Tanacetum cinerariifolium]